MGLSSLTSAPSLTGAHDSMGGVNTSGDSLDANFESVLNPNSKRSRRSESARQSERGGKKSKKSKKSKRSGGSSSSKAQSKRSTVSKPE